MIRRNRKTSARTPSTTRRQSRLYRKISKAAPSIGPPDAARYRIESASTIDSRARRRWTIKPLGSYPLRRAPWSNTRGHALLVRALCKRYRSMLRATENRYRLSLRLILASTLAAGCDHEAGSDRSRGSLSTMRPWNTLGAPSMGLVAHNSGSCATSPSTISEPSRVEGTRKRLIDSLGSAPPQYPPKAEARRRPKAHREYSMTGISRRGFRPRPPLCRSRYRPVA